MEDGGHYINNNTLLSFKYMYVCPYAYVHVLSLVFEYMYA